MDSLLLDRTLWDLCLDAAGNIAVASDPYSIAQNVASTLRLFQGELWYDTSKGIPYFEQVLGESPAIGTVKQFFISAALDVAGVVTAVCYLDGVDGRNLTGQVQVTDETGALSAIGLGAPNAIVPVN